MATDFGVLNLNVSGIKYKFDLDKIVWFNEKWLRFENYQ